MRQMEVLDYMRLRVRSCAGCGTETEQPVVGIDPLHLRTMQIGQDLTVQETTWCPACASQTQQQQQQQQQVWQQRQQHQQPHPQRGEAA